MPIALVLHMRDLNHINCLHTQRMINNLTGEQFLNLSMYTDIGMNLAN